MSKPSISDKKAYAAYLLRGKCRVREIYNRDESTSYGVTCRGNLHTHRSGEWKFKTREEAQSVIPEIRRFWKELVER